MCMCELYIYMWVNFKYINITLVVYCNYLLI